MFSAVMLLAEWEEGLSACKNNVYRKKVLFWNSWRKKQCGQLEKPMFIVYVEYDS